jgi:hypothetical protein
MATVNRMTAAAMGAGSAAEALGGAAAIVLGIIGLLQIRPQSMAAIAAIVVGCALIFESAAISSRYSHLRSLARAGGSEAAIGGGVTAEMLGGIAGVVLGSLGVVGIASRYVIPAAVIVFGVSLLVGAAQTTALQRQHITSMPSTVPARAVRAGLGVASGAEVLVGIAAIVLGAIAIAQIATLVLSLVGLLCVGVAVLLDGTATGAKAARAVAV